MNTAYGVRSSLAGGYQRGKPVRNEKYKAFVRRFACCVCESTRRVEAAHTGSHGMGTKSSDLQVIPLCALHHQTGTESLHALGPLEFAAVHGLDITKLILKFNGLFESTLKGA